MTSPYSIDTTNLSPLQYLAKIKAAIANEMKYKILGTSDTLFQTLTRALPEEKFETMRLARTGAAIIVKKHEDSTDPNSRKLTAEAQGRFAYKASQEIYNVRQTGEPKKLAAAISAISKELETAVTNYVSAAGENGETTRDRAFEMNAKSAYDKLHLAITTLKPRLRAILQYRNINIVGAEKALANIKTTLDNFTPGASSAATVPPSSGGSGSTVDVTV